MSPAQPCSRKSTHNTDGLHELAEKGFWIDVLLLWPPSPASNGLGFWRSPAEVQDGASWLLGHHYVQAQRCAVCCYHCKKVQGGCGISILGDSLIWAIWYKTEVWPNLKVRSCLEQEALLEAGQVSTHPNYSVIGPIIPPNSTWSLIWLFQAPLL